MTSSGSPAGPWVGPSAPLDGILAAELLRLERALAERDPAAVSGGLAELLADAFVEFGSSGRTWDRPDTIDVLLSAPLSGSIEIRELAIRPLAPDVVLATYAAAVPSPEGRRHTLRTSIWVHWSGRWQILFHQGTLVP